MLKHFFRIFIAIIAIIVSGNSTFAVAEDRLSEGRLSISPFLIDTEVGPGKSSQHSITIYNTDSIPHQLSYAIQDFVPQGPKGEPRFLSESEFSDPTISASSWITVLKQPDFTVPANSSTEVIFKVEAPSNATAGSHYAGLLFSFESTTDQNITVARKIGAIILARYGKGKPNAELQVLSTKNVINKPFHAEISVQNTGNVHISPKGKLNLYNVFGRLVESIPVNPNAEIILPGLHKTFFAESTGWRAGIYKAETIVYYSTEPKLELRHAEFVGIWPMTDIALLLGGILTLILLLRFLVKRYNQWIVRKYQ